MKGHLTTGELVVRKPPKNQSSDPRNDYQVEQSHQYRTPPATPERPVVPQVNVLPYRGQEYHGVNPNLAGPPPDQNADVFDQSLVKPDKQDERPVDIRPVPVHIVNLSSRERRAFRTSNLPVSNVAMAIAGHDPSRTSLMIKNTDAANTIYISDNSNPNPVTSYPLGPGVEASLSTEDAVYAISPTAPVNVALLSEMTIKE